MKGGFAISLTSIWTVWVFQGEEGKRYEGERRPVFRGYSLQTGLCQGFNIDLLVQEPHVCPWVALTELSHYGRCCSQGIHCPATCCLCLVAIFFPQPGLPA